jgi:uncharacterized protein (DUF2141 family)
MMHDANAPGAESRSSGTACTIGRAAIPRQRPHRRSLILAAGVWSLLAAPAIAQPASQTARPCVSPTEAAPQRILVTVTGARRVAGNITFTLYGARPAAFLAHKGSIALQRVTLAGPSAAACFAVSAPGTYAVAVYHDENDNHHFDRSLIGLPVEGYGFSNNAPIFMAPPSFGAVRFTVEPGDTRIAIALRY